MESLKPSFLPCIGQFTSHILRNHTESPKDSLVKRLKLERIVSVPSRPLRLIVSVNFCMASEMNFVTFPSAGFARIRVGDQRLGEKPMSSTP